MKHVLVFLFLLAGAGNVYAGDSLSTTFRNNFKAARVGAANFYEAISQASTRTFTLKDVAVREALMATHLPDTAAMRQVVNGVVGRFADNELMGLECAEPYDRYTEVFDAFTAAICPCLADAYDKLDVVLKRTKGYMAVLDKCMAAASRDGAFVSKAQAVAKTDAAGFTKVAPCASPYVFVHCAELHQDLLANSYNMGYAKLKYDKGQEEEHVRDLMKNILLGEGTDLGGYCVTKAACSKAVAQLAECSKRLKTLKAKREELMWHKANDGNKTVLTWMYAGKKPEIICRLVLETEWPGYDLKIKQLTYVPARDVKDAAKMLAPYMDDTPPPVKELK